MLLRSATVARVEHSLRAAAASAPVVARCFASSSSSELPDGWEAITRKNGA